MSLGGALVLPSSDGEFTLVDRQTFLGILASPESIATVDIRPLNTGSRVACKVLGPEVIADPLLASLVANKIVGAEEVATLIKARSAADKASPVANIADKIGTMKRSGRC